MLTWSFLVLECVINTVFTKDDSHEPYNPDWGRVTNHPLCVADSFLAPESPVSFHHHQQFPVNAHLFQNVSVLSAWNWRTQQSVPISQ